MLFLALRQMLARKKQTLLILIGIALGTMMYVVIAGMQLGMRAYFVQKLLSTSPHVLISAPDEVIREDSVRRQFFPDRFVHWITPPSGKRDEAHISYPMGWFNRFRDDPRVIGYSPTLTVNVILSRGKIKQNGTLLGIIPERFRQVIALESSMKEGRLGELAGAGNRIIAGSGLLEELGARVNDTVLVTIGAAEPRPFKVVGSFEFGNEQVDKTTLYAHLSDVQLLDREPGRISEIGVKLIDMNQAREVAAEWKLGTRDRVESWQETFASLFQVFYVQDVTRWIISASILIVAAFGVYNVLSILITQKQREIAILRSIGYPPRKILQLFLIQGLLLGTLGASVGLVLGYFANVGISQIRIAGFRGVSLTHLMVSQAPSNYVIAFGMAVISATVASLLPARQASRLTPLDIIRGA